MFGVKKPVIGMLHIPSLPGAPLNKLDLKAITRWVLDDAKALTDGGVDGLLLENFGDIPFYPEQVPPHTVAFMTVLGAEVKGNFRLPLGINVLRNDPESALAIAAAVSAEFIRVNIHVGARLTDQGVVQGSAHSTIRYRKLLGSDIKIYADVDVKHSAPLAARGLRNEVEEMVTRGCADAVIVTGSATGHEASLEDLKSAKAAAGSANVIAGSGLDPANVTAVLKIADALIVGTSFKQGGITTNPVDPGRVQAFMEAVRKVRTALPNALQA
jgi:membrane complex biogenesis BtpA family protein